MTHHLFIVRKLAVVPEPWKSANTETMIPIKEGSAMQEQNKAVCNLYKLNMILKLTTNYKNINKNGRQSDTCDLSATLVYWLLQRLPGLFAA